MSLRRWKKCIWEKNTD